MRELLRDAGFRTNSLGISIPFASLIKAVQQTRPKLFWLSVSHIGEADFVEQLVDARIAAPSRSRRECDVVRD